MTIALISRKSPAKGIQQIVYQILALHPAPDVVQGCLEALFMAWYTATIWQR